MKSALQLVPVSGLLFAIVCLNSPCTLAQPKDANYDEAKVPAYMEQDPAIAAKQVAVMGHSRLGKTALWAGAQDERFAMVISNNSGEGGASLVRRRFGENIAHSVSMVPWWYCTRYRQYADNENALPVDAHELIALIAPRPVYVASATQDLWADPRGEFLAAKNAEPVYRLFGRPGLGVSEMPLPEESVGEFIGYHRDPGQRLHGDLRSPVHQCGTRRRAFCLKFQRG